VSETNEQRELKSLRLRCRNQENELRRMNKAFETYGRINSRPCSFGNVWTEVERLRRTQLWTIRVTIWLALLAGFVSGRIWP
jgi:hypothetical protein